jgi:hypothetical protein
MYNEITKCRISGSSNLVTVLSLGNQYLTGVFPKTKEEQVVKGPVDLVWCPDSGLLQMKQTYNLNAMYGDNYGYRSGLNSSMVKHLQEKIKYLESLTELYENDVVIDIGSNDATSLKAYSGKHKKFGIDPTGEKFKQYYTDDITLIPDFFNSQIVEEKFNSEKAKIITSIAMFYDLESPMEFVENIERCLADDGIWHFEQSYMPSMLNANSYDTICHEHLEFYSLKVVKDMLDKKGLRIINVQMNAINGGSFAVTACKKRAKHVSEQRNIDILLSQENEMGLDTLQPYREFEERAKEHRRNLIELIEGLVADGKKVFGYGASTKGNVLLQYCGFTAKQIAYIAEVNEDKFGAYTPGTLIPIISEAEANEMNPDYYLVLPWHFKENILAREQAYLAKGGKFIFPFPAVEII